MFARIAIHGDKYNCTNALRSWTRTWYSDVKELMLPADIVGRGLLLLASHFLRYSDASCISLEVWKHFNPDKICLAWAADEDSCQLLLSNLMSIYIQSGP